MRNLPNSYKLGQKKTNLGRVIYVSLYPFRSRSYPSQIDFNDPPFSCLQLEIDKSALNVDQGTQIFNFDILLRDKFPFQPPLIMTKTKFCNPSLADGRDLLTHVLPPG